MGIFRDYMAKGVNINSDETVAKEIIWMSIGKGMTPDQIAADETISQVAMGITPRSIYRILGRYGLSGRVRKQIKNDSQAAQAYQQGQYDKSHGVNTFGTQPGLPSPQAQHSARQGYGSSPTGAAKELTGYDPLRVGGPERLTDPVDDRSGIIDLPQNSIEALWDDKPAVQNFKKSFN